MEMPIYYGLFLVRSIVDLFCAVFIMRVFFSLHPQPALKRMIIALPIFLLFMLLCAYSYTLSERNILLSLMSLVYNYSGTIILLFAGFAGEKKGALYFLIAYEIIIAIIVQTSMFALNISISIINIETITLLNLANIAWGTIILSSLILADRRIIFKTRNSNVFVLPKNISFLIMLTLFCVALLENNILDPENIAGLSQALTVMLVALLVILIIYLLLINNTKTFSEKMVDMLSKQIALQINHYETLKLHDEEMRGFRHDFNNMMTCLMVILESGDTKQAMEYIETFKGITLVKNKQFDTGNYIVDALLNTKSQEAAKHDVTILFNGFIPTMRIATFDLCVVITNALDNAIEACSELQGRKSININSKIENNSWFIFIDNPVAQPVRILRNMIATTKKDKAIHGFGLRNIERVVQKYSGNMSLECEEDTFIFSARLVLDENII
jgi:hypothetical protein